MRNSLFQIRSLQRSGASQQVTIPKTLMEVLGLQPGDKVYMYVVGHVLCMKRFDEGGFYPEVVAVRSQESNVSSQEEMPCISKP